MKKIVVSVIMLFILLAATKVLINQQPENSNTDVAKKQMQEKEKIINQNKINLYEINGDTMFSLKELGDKLSYEWRYYPDEGAIDIFDGNNSFHLLRDTSVVSKNGIYLPIEFEPYINSANEVFLPEEMLVEVFHINTEFLNDNSQEIFVFADTNKINDSSKNLNEFTNSFASMNEEEILSYLSFLKIPLKDAHISTRDSHLPGAARAYRNGYHEGIDWYGGATGIPIDRSTPILSMADGVVVRADHDYVEFTQEERDKLLSLAENMDHTPEHILDKLRGRTVWVQYPNGVLVRYAHLTKIKEGIEVGKTVKQGEILGYVGNSGTSDGVLGNDQGLHLHSDILIYDHLFWEHLNSEQVKYILDNLF